MTNQTIEQAVEEIVSTVETVEFLHGVPVNLPSQYKADLRGVAREALQAQRDAGAREERKNIIEIVKFTKFRDTQTQEPHHKYLQQSKGVDYIRNKILKALTPPTK